MSDFYRDDLHSGAGPRLVPPSLARAAGAAVFLLLVLGMAFWAYRLGTRDAGEVPIIRAMEGPPRVQPEDPGGLQAAHQGLEVNSVLAGEADPAPAASAAAPEPAAREAAPSPATLLAEEDGPQGELIVALPELPDVSDGDGAELRMPPQEDGPDPAVQLVRPEDAPFAIPDLPRDLAGAAGIEEAPDAEAPRPLGRPSGLADRPVEVATAAQDGAAPPDVAAPPAAAATSRVIQLGAYDNEILALQVWDQMMTRHSDVLGARNLYVERATSNARVFYRLRVSGFDDPDQTRRTCDTLRGRGVDCVTVQ